MAELKLKVETVGDVRALFSYAKKRLRARRALWMLVIGPQGVLLARRLAHLVPPPKLYDQGNLELLYKGGKHADFSRRAPFRAPHYTASRGELFGSVHGKALYPGEISLAHSGTLYLDDAMDFSQKDIRQLFSVARSGSLVLAMGAERIVMPAKPALIMAMVDAVDRRVRKTFEMVDLDVVLEWLPNEEARSWLVAQTVWDPYQASLSWED